MSQRITRPHMAALSLLVGLALLTTACTDTIDTAQEDTSVAEVAVVSAGSYAIVDTGQSDTYGAVTEIEAPAQGDAFFGQDAQIEGDAPSYTDNGDGTVTDNVTGLVWTQSPDLDGNGDINAADKLSYDDALANAGSITVGGYDDWRLPKIKELYSLMNFDGVDPSGYSGTDTADLVPFIDTDFFDFAYGDTDADERVIDAQMASSTLYTDTTMNGNETMFGVNFADGRIKGYPTGPMPGSSEDKGFYVYYVRGNTAYGINDFTENSDGTITDMATGLMWAQDDSGEGMDWEAALTWAEQANAESYLGYNDWRLPNVKELQSIVDYTRAPGATDSAAIDPVFECTPITNEAGERDYAAYWSSTTHIDRGL
ncbi:MAG: DUF1566 domain-containing protein, partial [Actinomycetota bacterium]|nr:DUF1566 domain-containing protein [Actinomycetota bacterium]